MYLIYVHTLNMLTDLRSESAENMTNPCGIETMSNPEAQQVVAIVTLMVALNFFRSNRPVLLGEACEGPQGRQPMSISPST